MFNKNGFKFKILYKLKEILVKFETERLLVEEKVQKRTSLTRFTVPSTAFTGMRWVSFLNTVFSVRFTLCTSFRH